MENFYGTGIQIWAGVGPVGITEKKKIFGPIMSNFWGWFFHVFMGQKKEEKKCNVCTKGQFISNAIYGLLTSPKKQTNGRIFLFAFLLFSANKSNSSKFLRESMACQSVFWFYLTFKKLHKMKLKNIFKHFQLWFAPLETPHRGTSLWWLWLVGDGHPRLEIIVPRTLYTVDNFTCQSSIVTIKKLFKKSS